MSNEWIKLLEWLSVLQTNHLILLNFSKAINVHVNYHNAMDGQHFWKKNTAFTNPVTYGMLTNSRQIGYCHLSIFNITQWRIVGKLASCLVKLAPTII